MSQFIEVLKTLPSIAWPLIVAILVWRLFPFIKSIIESRQFSVKVAGMEISVQSATEQIAKQIEDLQKQVIEIRSANSPAHAEVSLPDKALVESNERKRLLWVDDQMQNNALEIAQLQRSGFTIHTTPTTEDALATLSTEPKFDGVISDMGRREGPGYRSQAGLFLLRKMRESGFEMPFVVYSSQRRAAEHDRDVKSSSGDGAISSPVKLIEWAERLSS